MYRKAGHELTVYSANLVKDLKNNTQAPPDDSREESFLLMTTLQRC